MKEVLESNTNNNTHRRYKHILQQINKKCKDENLTIEKADKGRTLVIINKETYQQKIEAFLKENQYSELNKDPTTHYQKQIIRTIQRCKTLNLRQQQLTQIKPRAPKLNARIKVHKAGNPIRPVVNYRQGPAYKLAKWLSRKLIEVINLPNTYNVYNSKQIAQNLIELNINTEHKIKTYDIKDLYVNLPTKEITKITLSGMAMNNIDRKLSTEYAKLIKVTINQNYFEHNGRFYKPKQGVAMGSPISGLIAEIYLQHLEKTYIKHWLEGKEIIYYNRYVDDIIIIYDSTETDEDKIENQLNSIQQNLKFNGTEDKHNQINYLDRTIKHDKKELTIDIYRKPTMSDVTIHFTSNNPMEHKLAAYQYLFHRAYNLPITKQARIKELETISEIAHNNGFPTNTIQKLQNKIKRKIKINRSTQKNIAVDRENKNKKKRAIFRYHSPAIRKTTNLFQKTDIKIVFKTPNTTYKLLQGNQLTEQYESDGIYGIKCCTCNQWYIGQTGRSLSTRHKEHIRYIRQNQTTSAYAMHILNNNHEYGPITETMRLLKHCKKSTTMNCWEDLFIQKYKEDKLIRQQQTSETNPLFKLARINTEQSEPNTD